MQHEDETGINRDPGHSILYKTKDIDELATVSGTDSFYTENYAGSNTQNMHMYLVVSGYVSFGEYYLEYGTCHEMKDEREYVSMKVIASTDKELHTGYLDLHKDKWIIAHYNTNKSLPDEIEVKSIPNRYMIQEGPDSDIYFQVLDQNGAVMTGADAMCEYCGFTDDSCTDKQSDTCPHNTNKTDRSKDQKKFSYKDMSDYLNFVEDNYHYHSSAWHDRDTDDMVKRDEMLDKFIDKLNGKK